MLIRDQVSCHHMVTENLTRLWYAVNISQPLTKMALLNGENTQVETCASDCFGWILGNKMGKFRGHYAVMLGEMKHTQVLQKIFIQIYKNIILCFLFQKAKHFVAVINKYNIYFIKYNNNESMCRNNAKAKEPSDCLPCG